ncbi:MAG: hypothetical protein KatS3mg019_1136 [Fimbriimonadales bacterium]|nr:MAG: hypothetical protein KatS3mg019_1136 [Fimbriimonadales bacterium]
MRIGNIVRRTLVGALAAILSGWIAYADSPRLYWVGTFGGSSSEALGVSANGTVVGWSFTANGQRRGLIWTRDSGIRVLDTLGGNISEAYGISRDGNIVVGYSNTPDLRSRAVRWESSNQTMEDLGAASPAQARGISADGSVIVGQTNGVPFRWTQATGVQPLSGIPTGWLGNALSTSADGAVVVGFVRPPSTSFRAFLWRDGVLQILPTLQSGSNAFGIAADVSDDARIAVGQANTLSGSTRAVRWVDGAIEELGTLGGNSQALGVSANGRRIVGSSLHLPSTQERAFLWTESNGMIDLNEAYASLLPAGARLIRATDISADGRYIVGIGINPETGRQEGFLLDTIPEPTSMLMLSAGLAGLILRRRG